jgi:hypothetical protein
LCGEDLDHCRIPVALPKCPDVVGDEGSDGGRPAIGTGREAAVLGTGEQRAGRDESYRRE